MKMMTMLLAIALAGCVTTGARGPEVLEGTENSVTVNWANSTQGVSGALTAADQHCAKYGKHAQFAGKLTDFQFAYNCVK
ncbi:MAG: hypothetical protein JSR19_07025 [Proteobacteria bacterium]|nr:hypothetical protein [Pseudomonadota bacterium]